MYRFNGGVSNIQSDVKTVVGNTNTLKNGVVKSIQSGKIEDYVLNKNGGTISIPLNSINPNKALPLFDFFQIDENDTRFLSLSLTNNALIFKYDAFYSGSRSVTFSWRIIEFY